MKTYYFYTPDGFTQKDFKSDDEAMVHGETIKSLKQIKCAKGSRIVWDAAQAE